MSRESGVAERSGALSSTRTFRAGSYNIAHGRGGVMGASNRDGGTPSEKPDRTIDWILINDRLEFTNFEVPAVKYSDHLPVMASVRLRQSL